MKRSEYQRVVDKSLLTLRMQGRAVTFRAVAELAGLSPSTLYRSAGLRELIQEHRDGSALLGGRAIFLDSPARVNVLDSCSWKREGPLLQSAGGACNTECRKK
ncbi:hypothetical protein D3C74_161280 [compost metagenome]